MQWHSAVATFGFRHELWLKNANRRYVPQPPTMSRILIACTAGLLFITSHAHAQLGVSAGMNLATMVTRTNLPERKASANSRSGYQVSIFYEKQLSERFSVVPELSFSRQSVGLKLEDYHLSDGAYAAQYQLGLSYLNMPVLLRATFGKFYLEAGPQLGLQVAAHEQGAEEKGSIAGSREYTIDRPATDRYRRLDVALSAGVGVKLPAGFGLGIRASAGLLPLTGEQPTHRHEYRAPLRNQVVQASLSYQLGS